MDADTAVRIDHVRVSGLCETCRRAAAYQVVVTTLRSGDLTAEGVCEACAEGRWTAAVEAGMEPVPTMRHTLYNPKFAAAMVAASHAAAQVEEDEREQEEKEPN